MAETVGSNPTSQGTLPAAHQAIPVLERSVATQAESQVPNFTGAYSELALTPTAIGAAASTVITQSGIKLSEKQGYDAANRNPNMKVFPSLTESDKAFENAYISQSSASLGLQSQSLINDNMEEISKANALTPELISSFTKSSASGVQGILQNAPDSVKASLGAQYAEKLQNQSHNLNMKMIEQQKTQAAENAQSFRIDQSNNMQDSIRERTPQSLEAAAQTKDDIDRNINASEQSGLITRTQAQASRVSNKLNYESGLQINNALSARENGKLEPFLVELNNKKLPGLTWAESEAVQDNVLKAVSQIEKSTSRNEQLTLADGNNLIATGKMTPDRLESMRPDLTPREFLNLSTKYAISNHAQSATSQKIDSLVSNASNAKAYNGATKDQINAAYNSLVASKLAENPDMSQDEAEFQVASLMNHPVPQYIDGINNGIMSGDLSQAMSSIEQYRRMHAEDGFKTTGVNDKSITTAEMFLVTQGEYPGDPQKALSEARDLVSNKDDETIKLNKQKIHEFYTKHAATTSTLQSQMVKIGGLGSGDYQNLTAFTNDMRDHFDAYMQYTNGNEDVSKTMASNYAKKAYAETSINGVKETAYLPVDSAINVPVNGTALIQSDIHANLSGQFDEGKKAFDNGTLDSYWRLKDRVSFEDYAKAKSTVNEALNRKGYLKAARSKQGLEQELSGKSGITALRESVKEERDIVSDYESAKPIEVEQVMRNGDVHMYHIQTSSSPMTSVSSTTGQVVGPYLTQVKDPITGITSNIHSYFGSTRTMPEYRPDAEWIRSNYLAVNGIDQTWNNYVKSQDKQAEAMAMLRNPATRPRHVGGL